MKIDFAMGIHGCRHHLRFPVKSGSVGAVCCPDGRHRSPVPHLPRESNSPKSLDWMANVCGRRTPVIFKAQAECPARAALAAGKPMPTIRFVVWKRQAAAAVIKVCLETFHTIFRLAQMPSLKTDE